MKTIIMIIAPFLFSGCYYNPVVEGALVGAATGAITSAYGGYGGYGGYGHAVVYHAPTYHNVGYPYRYRGAYVPPLYVGPPRPHGYSGHGGSKPFH